MLDKNRKFNSQNKIYGSDQNQNQKYCIYPQGAIKITIQHHH